MSILKDDPKDSIQLAFKNHARRWKNNRYVYPVVSRRSGGISVGINLNPDKKCNFHCVYCQVDRRYRETSEPLDPDRLREELDAIIRDEKSGFLYNSSPFQLLPPESRGIRDIAFSGDGEPTASADFDAAVDIAARLRIRFKLTDTRIVLITNGSCLNEPSVRKSLAVLDRNNGEIWAKLDAGTEEYFHKINRAEIGLEKIIINILEAARVRPLIIQSMQMRIEGRPPQSSEIEAFCNRLNELLSSGGHLKALHLLTIARLPTETYVSPLLDEELDTIAQAVRSKVAIPIQVFYEKGHYRNFGPGCF